MATGYAIRIDPVTEHQARVALDAYDRFGTGSGQPAGLNYGDCFSYSLASDTGEPLLFKSDEFAATDVPGQKMRCLPSPRGRLQRANRCQSVRSIE